MNRQIKGMRGISLLEGLVAVVVLAIGLLALFQFQSGVLRSGNDAKTRTEALQIAEARLGELRDIASHYPQFVAATGGADASLPAYLQTTATTLDTRDRPAIRQRLGNDADITTTVSNTYPPTVMVVLQWTGAGTPPANIGCPTQGKQCVRTGAVIGLEDPVSGVVLAETTAAGGFIRPPTGEAEYGADGDITDVDLAGTPVDQEISPGDAPNRSILRDKGDGVKLVKDGAGVYQLVDGSGQVLIKSQSPLAIVGGTVYVAAGTTLNLDHIKVGAPDVSWCTTASADEEADGITAIRYPVRNPSDQLIYTAIPYYCYVGTGWYGAIGPLVYDPTNPSTDPLRPDRSGFSVSDRVCVGEDAVLDTGESDSRHPKLSYIRTYRGYTPVGGLDENADLVFASSGIVNVVDQTDEDERIMFERYGHDFALATISSATDANCDTVLHAGDAAYLETGAPDPDDWEAVTFNAMCKQPDCPDPNPSLPDAGNPGAFYCLTESCPDPLPPNPTLPATGGTSLVIAGYFRTGTSTAQGTPVQGGLVTTSDGQSCSTSGSDGLYTCSIKHVGNSWNGTITATAPSGYVVVQDARDGGAQRSLTIPPDSADQDFYLANTGAVSVISGSVYLYEATYSGLTSSVGSTAGSCVVMRDGTLAIQGRFICTYPVAISGATVKITALTGNTLCGTSSGTGTPSADSSVSQKTLTLTGSGVNDGLANVRLNIARNNGACPR